MDEITYNKAMAILADLKAAVIKAAETAEAAKAEQQEAA